MDSPRLFLGDITNSPRPSQSDGEKLNAAAVLPFDHAEFTSKSSSLKSSPARLQQLPVLNQEELKPRCIPQKRESPSKKNANKRCVRKRPGLTKLVIRSPSAAKPITPVPLMTGSFKNQQAYKTVCSKITDFLYVGGVDVAKDIEIMKSCGITHVINMCGCSAPNYFATQFAYLRLPIRDHTSVDISTLLFSLISFIEQVRRDGGVVLVHCVKGISRSTTVSIAYLMWSRRWTLNDAFRYVKTCRPIINPNSGFFFQLNDWGNQLQLHQGRLDTASGGGGGGISSSSSGSSINGSTEVKSDMCKRCVMFRVRVGSSTTDDDYSSIPAVEGPFGFDDDTVPSTPSSASSTDEREGCVMIFHQFSKQRSAPPTIWHRQQCNDDLLAQARGAAVMLQTLGMLPADLPVAECEEGSEPEALATSIAAMRRHCSI